MVSRSTSVRRPIATQTTICLSQSIAGTRSSRSSNRVAASPVSRLRGISGTACAPERTTKVWTGRISRRAGTALLAHGPPDEKTYAAAAPVLRAFLDELGRRTDEITSTPAPCAAR